MVRQPQSGNKSCQLCNRDEDSDLGVDGPWKPAWWDVDVNLAKPLISNILSGVQQIGQNDGVDKNSVKIGMVVKTWIHVQSPH